jgi:hypothetical protein
MGKQSKTIEDSIKKAIENLSVIQLSNKCCENNTCYDIDAGCIVSIYCKKCETFFGAISLKAFKEMK